MESNCIYYPNPGIPTDDPSYRGYTFGKFFTSKRYPEDLAGVFLTICSLITPINVLLTTMTFFYFKSYTGIKGRQWILLAVFSSLLSFSANSLYYGFLNQNRMQNQTDSSSVFSAFMFFAGNLIPRFHLTWVTSKSLKQYKYTGRLYHERCIYLTFVLFVVYFVVSFVFYLSTLSVSTENGTEIVTIEVPKKGFKIALIGWFALASLVLYAILFSTYYYFSFVKRVMIVTYKRKWIDIKKSVFKSLIATDILLLVLPLMIISAQQTSLAFVTPCLGYTPETLCIFFTLFHHLIYLNNAYEPDPEPKKPEVPIINPYVFKYFYDPNDAVETVV